MMRHIDFVKMVIYSYKVLYTLKLQEINEVMLQNFLQAALAHNTRKGAHLINATRGCFCLLFFLLPYFDI